MRPFGKDSDGPGGYSAEVNVKGKVIFGYTWNVRDIMKILAITELLSALMI